MQSTTINIVDKGNLKKSYSFNFAGGQLTHAVSSALGLGREEAEKIKNEQGLTPAKDKISETLYLLIDPLLIEVKDILYDFYAKNGKEADEIYLTGGTSALPGLQEYFKEVLKKNVEIPNCFSEFLYPPIIGGTLEKMAPAFSAAVGAALGGLETQN